MNARLVSYSLTVLGKLSVSDSLTMLLLSMYMSVVLLNKLVKWLSMKHVKRFKRKHMET